MAEGFLDDLADSLAPWRTADLGCIAVRKVSQGGVLHDDTGPTSLAAREEAARRAQEEQEKQSRGRGSLALIQLIQTAIERREKLLRELGESIGTPADHMTAVGADKAQAAANARGAPISTPIGRLALEDFPDQALAREELAPVDLAAARVDMSELLPRNAFDPDYANATTSHAQRSAASMGSFLGMRPADQAPGGGASSYSYYTYDDAPGGYSGEEYGGGGDQYSYYDGAAQKADGGEASSNYSYEYYSEDSEKAGTRKRPTGASGGAAVAGGAALAGVSAATATAMVLQADRKASTAMPKPAGDELYEYEYYDEDVSGARRAGVGGVGSAAVASTARPAFSSSTGVAACATSALQGSTAGGTASATGVGATQEDYEYYSDAQDAGPAPQPPPVAARTEEDEYEYYSDDAPGGQAAQAGDAKDAAAQRSEYLQRHTAALSSGAADVNAAEEENDEEFARQCVLSLQEGARATLMLQDAATARRGKPIVIFVQLVLSTDGLRLLWSPEPGQTKIAEQAGADASPPSGFVRTTDVRSVEYGGADPQAPPHPDEEARPSHTRFGVVTPFGTTNFAIAEPLKLQHFVCGLRHLARRPIDRRQFLWQRTASMNKDVIASQTFDNKLKTLPDYLQRQKSAAEQLRAQPRGATAAAASLELDV